MNAARCAAIRNDLWPALRDTRELAAMLDRAMQQLQIAWDGGLRTAAMRDLLKQWNGGGAI